LVTHDQDGRVVQRLSVSTKVSIGLPPNGDRNHPTKLDHFVFLRKKKSANRLRWEVDPELTRHYGEQCRELRVILIDDDIENVFLREEATYLDRKEKRKKTSSIWALSLAGCEKTLPCCHSESFAVILSEAKNLVLPAQDKLREESRSGHFHEHMRFFLLPQGGIRAA
jgi:hypothetical protein